MPEILETSIVGQIVAPKDDLPTKNQGPKMKKSEQEILSDFENTPLFMQSLPEDPESNDVLSALQALVYDGEPEEIAENFKNQGNDCFRSGFNHYQNAISYYTKGIEANPTKDPILFSTLYSNRAAVNLELKNYRRVLNDCALAIKYWPENNKAYFRSAKACLALDKMQEALDCIQRGSTLDPDNLAFKSEKRKCEERQKWLGERKNRLEKLQLEKEKEEKALMDLIQNVRKIRLKRSIQCTGHSDEDDDNVNNHVHHSETHLTKKFIDPTETSLAPPIQHPQAGTHRVHVDSASKTLKWPVLLLYPEYQESDFIQEFDELDRFCDHLEMMFPKDNHADWDTEHKYVHDRLDVYFETESSNGSRKLFKIDPEMSLLDVISSDLYEVVDGVPTFFVLVKSTSFSKEFRRRYK